MDFGRTLILGNSGSGKSWLSVRLAAVLGVEPIDLDHLHWEADGYNVPRSKQLAIALVRRAAAQPAWIIEGVYGWLAQEAALRATALIWLDLPVGDCIGNLQRRGVRGDGDAASFKELLAWAAEYPSRTTSSSWAGHERIFTAFPRLKLHCSSGNDISRCLAMARRGDDGSRSARDGAPA